MKIKKILPWSLIITTELFLIFMFGYIIINKQGNILGSSITPIRNSDVQQNDKADPRYFYEPIPNRTQYGEASWLTDRPKYYINSDGLNDNLEYSIKRGPGTFRIITLGDSFTFGQFVDTQNNYPKQLSKLLNSNPKCSNIRKFEVINLGVYGYDIEYSVERYRLTGQKYKPQLILWFLKDDDIQYINELMNQKVAEIKQSLTQKEIANFNKKENFYPEWSLAGESFINEFGIEKILDMQRSFFVQFNSLYSGPLVVFTFPYTKSTYKKFLSQHMQSRPKSFFFDKIENIYDMENCTLPDGHPNEKGYKIIANNIFVFLTKNNIISCK